MLRDPSPTDARLPGSAADFFAADSTATFVARRQAYLDALPVAAAVVCVHGDRPTLRARNLAYESLCPTHGALGVIAHFEFAKRFAKATDGNWAGESFHWRESNTVNARHFAVSMTPIGFAMSDSEPLVLVTLIDRTTEVRTEKSLRSEMLTDSLTGLPNRRGFIDRVEQRFASDSAEHFGIVVVDLARFSRINECIGSMGGDELIITVARRLMSTLRGYDQLGRTGANEFAMVVRVDGREELDHIIERVEAVLNNPCRLSDFEIKIECAIGCALVGPDADDPEQLLRFAQVALKSAKQSGNVECYQPATLAVARRRFALETELRRAIDQDRLELAFQPLVSLSTGKVCGFEALARWDHLDLGHVSPNEFIAVAEDSGLIVPLGRWALDRALRTLAEWDATVGVTLPLHCAVNLSPIQVARDDIAALVRETLAYRKIAGSRLTIELTESAIVADPARATKTLNALKACDVMVAMDDFGTGYSNLASLQRLPIDTLKIDRSFIAGMIDDPDKIAIVGAIQSLAAALGMMTTAEGIESKAQADRLRELGCSKGQGYLYSVPLAPDAALAFARKSLGI
ncbi:MAG: putative bifunctional diguanylate cyclase/phosphodiesterase [Sphingomonadaceae bacterium]